MNKIRLDVAYTLIIAVLALGSLSLSEKIEIRFSALFRECASIILLICTTFLIHVPALFPVAKIRQILGRQLPVETFFPIGIFALWSLVGVIMGGGIWRYALIGAMFGLGSGLGFWALKVNVKALAQIALKAAPNPQPGLEPLKVVLMRSVYSLRTIVVALSLGTATVHLGFALPVFGSAAALALLTGFACVWLSAFGNKQIHKCALIAQQDAGRMLERQEKASGIAEVLLYVSDKPNSEHARIETLSSRLSREGVRFAIVAREAVHAPRLRQFGANYVWLAPYIACLDATARPNAQAVFYTNDGIKNGHFTRFGHLCHILDATTGTLAKSDTLSEALNMYDYIIAPAPDVAVKWRTYLPLERAQKVITLNLNPLTPLAAQAVLSSHTDMALVLPAPKSDNDYPSAEEIYRINTLVARFTAPSVATQTLGEVTDDAKSHSDRGHLHIGIATTETGPLTPWHRTLEALGTNNANARITVRFERQEKTWNRAEIILAQTHSQVTELRATAKPILWVGTGTAPIGTCTVDLMHRDPLFAAANLRPKPDPLHFTTLRGLLDYVGSVEQHRDIAEGSRSHA